MAWLTNTDGARPLMHKTFEEWRGGIRQHAANGGHRVLTQYVEHILDDWQEERDQLLARIALLEQSLLKTPPGVE